MSRKLNDTLKSEKSYLSYADLHHEITKSEEDSSPEPNCNRQNQEACRRASEEDELVKYMSKLPGYLERGEKIREKILNVGVLDWDRLEQWQYGHNHVPHRSSLTSTSPTLSSVSADGSSGNSIGGPSWSPSRQRMLCPALPSQFLACPVQACSVAVKSSGGGAANCPSLGDSHSNGDTNGKFVLVDDSHSQNHSISILKVCKTKCMKPHSNRERSILPNNRMCKAASCTKLKVNMQNGGTEKRVENLGEPTINTVDQSTLRQSKPIVLLLPGDMPQNSHSGAAPDMGMASGQKLGSPSRTRYSEKLKEPPHKPLNGCISRSCPKKDEVSRSHSRLKESGSSSIYPESIKILAPTSSVPFPVKTGISPCKSRKAEERKQTIATTSFANGSSREVDQKATTEKSRSSSPFRRLSIGIGFTNKGSGCKDISHVPHQSSFSALKSSSEHVRGGYARSNISGNDKPSDATKSRTSPLRRLLDPLLKPKAANCGHTMESSQKDSVLINKNCRSGNGKFSTLLPERELVRDHRVGCATINTTDSSKDKKCMPSTIQALFRIAVRNGQPLFTFAVDNSSNILAATVKNLPVPRKDECNCIYSFFTLSEVKKKNGIWMNQPGKSKGPDYIHHVVAQMKVSETHYSDSASRNCMDSSTAKEFVLFSVMPRQSNAQVSDYQPNDELAAVVVKSPKANNFMNNEHQNSCKNDSEDLVGVTVVLPSGVHSLPSDGGPSSLIERWKTGGSCDCGGWDLACKLKILANAKQNCRKSRTSRAYFAYRLELFLQGNDHDHDQENRPAFSFSPFKPGIYSVAFDSSLSHLQAFSICIALVDGKMPYELCGSRNLIGGKNLREMMSAQTEELKAFEEIEAIPDSYVAYPLFSPVGRV